MCLIIDAPAASSIPQSLLDSAWSCNSDGWGTMHCGGGKIHVAHGMKLKALRKQVARLEDTPVTVHFRWATHGTIGIENCHPFALEHRGHTYAVAHNGVLQIERTDPSMSDTYHWVHGSLPAILDAAEFTAPGFRKLAEDSVGRSNKLVILRDDGAKVMLNRSAGSEWQGVWLSNTLSIPRQKWSPPAPSRWAREPIWASNPLRYPAEDPWEQEEWAPGLEDLAALRWEDLRDYCRTHPEVVADAILECLA